VSQFITLEGGQFLVRIKICEWCGSLFGLSLEGSKCPNLECRSKLIEVDIPEEELKEKLDGQLERSIGGENLDL